MKTHGGPADQTQQWNRTMVLHMLHLQGGGLLDHLAAKEPTVTTANWSIPNPGPPQFGALLYYDNFNGDDVFLVFRRSVFHMGPGKFRN